MTMREESAESQANRGPDSSVSRRAAARPAFTQARERSAGQPEATEPGDCRNVLSKSARFTGTIIVEDSMRLEGTFKGEVLTKATLVVAQDAEVEAKIQAEFAVIGGNFKGEVNCERRIDLLSSCRAEGKLVTDGLSIQDGAVFDGVVEMSRKS